jgi:hypothetical protein
VWLVAALLAGCLTYAKQAEQVRQGLIGMPSRSLHGCLGEPQAVDLREEVEYLTYRWALGEPFAEFPEPDRIVPGAEMQGPIVIGGRRPRPSLDPDKGFCQLVFELREHRVANVTAHGRFPSGLNADVQCVIKAERCLER